MAQGRPAAMRGGRGIWAPAGFWVRALAGLGDLILVMAPMGILSSIGPLEFVMDFLPGLPFLALGIYSVVMLAQTGQTLGMRALGLRVVHPQVDGPGLGYRLALLRLLGFIPSALLVVGTLSIIWDRDKQAWHDRIVGTYVIRESASWTPNLIIRELTGRFESLQTSLHALKNTITLLPLDDTPAARHQAVLAVFEPANVRATRNHLSDALADLRGLRRRRGFYVRTLREAPGALARKYLGAVQALLASARRLEQYGAWFQRAAQTLHEAGGKMEAAPQRAVRQPKPDVPLPGDLQTKVAETVERTVGSVLEGLREAKPGLKDEIRRDVAQALAEARALKAELKRFKSVREDLHRHQPEADTTAEELFAALTNFRLLLTNDENNGLLNLVTQALEGLSLRSVISGAIQEVEGGAQAAGVAVEMEPGISPTLHIPGDPGPLQVTLATLLENAVEAVRRRADRPPDFAGRVTVGVHEDRQAVLLQIIDNGCGLTGERLALAQRGDRQSSKGPSGGLGLPSARRTLAQYPGGDLDIFSAGENQGATVTVRFDKVAR